MKKRFEWLTMQIKKHGFTDGAEVGTGTGKTMMEILKASPALHMIEVAYYPRTEQTDRKHLYYIETQKARKLFLKRARQFRGRIDIINKPSTEAANGVKDASLDFVFIDADHSYANCKADIEAWAPKVRPGGLLSGHDYEHPLFPGVTQAVHDVLGPDVLSAIDWVWYIWRP